MSVEVKTASESGDVEVLFNGTLEIGTVFPKLNVRLASRIIIECIGLRIVTSYGAQLWSNWMRSFDPRQQFVFRNVPEQALDLFNLIYDFLPPERVIESFFVPYHCDSCNYEENWLAQRGKDYLEAIGDQPAKVKMPEILNCQKCKGEMKIGIWESKYFRFLDKNPTPQP